MDIKKSIFGRRSVREYTSESIDQQTLRPLIDAAIHAPSALNAQPWAFTVVRDPIVLGRISKEAKCHMLANLSADGQSDHVGSLLEDPKFHIFYHAPALILISATAQGPWIVEDCALAAENLMLAGMPKDWVAAGLASRRASSTPPRGRNCWAFPRAGSRLRRLSSGIPKAFRRRCRAGSRRSAW